MDNEANSGDSPIELRLIVEHLAAPPRLDIYLASQATANLTRSRIQRLINDGLVTVNGAQHQKRYRVREGDVIVVTIPPAPRMHLEGEEIPLDIVYEDEHLAVVNKPAGLVTHPAPGNLSGTLVNAMIHHFRSLSTLSGPDRPGIVHRLDKNTSGLLIVARTDVAYVKLQRAVRNREVKRTYLALVCGHMAEKSGTIDLPIGRSRRDRKKMAVSSSHSREAVTHYRLLDRFRSYDLLEVELQTGRTHQIRVHFSHQGHPVFGDPDYGGRHKYHRGVFAPERTFAKELLAIMPHQALHATRLEFAHPITDEPMSLHRDPPDDFRRLLDVLDNQGR